MSTVHDIEVKVIVRGRQLDRSPFVLNARNILTFRMNVRCEEVQREGGSGVKKTRRKSNVV